MNEDKWVDWPDELGTYWVCINNKYDGPILSIETFIGFDRGDLKINSYTFIVRYPGRQKFLKITPPEIPTFEG